jgi:hypothetical protein
LLLAHAMAVRAFHATITRVTNFMRGGRLQTVLTVIFGGGRILRRRPSRSMLTKAASLLAALYVVGCSEPSSTAPDLAPGPRAQSDEVGDDEWETYHYASATISGVTEIRLSQAQSGERYLRAETQISPAGEPRCETTASFRTGSQRFSDGWPCHKAHLNSGSPSDPSTRATMWKDLFSIDCHARAWEISAVTNHTASWSGLWYSLGVVSRREAKCGPSSGWVPTGSPGPGMEYKCWSTQGAVEVGTYNEDGSITWRTVWSGTMQVCDYVREGTNGEFEM